MDLSPCSEGRASVRVVLTFYVKFFLVMKKYQAIFLLAIFFIFLFPNPGDTAENNTVVINEISWAGTKANSYDEWLELYNNSDNDIDLTGWKLLAQDNEPTINLTGAIKARGYFLLERTDENTITDITSDQIYNGSLSNSGEKLELKNTNNEIIDSVDCSSGWFAGDNTTKASMERKNPTKIGSQDNWAANNGQVINGKDASNNNIIGTPREKNSVFEEGIGEPLIQPAPVVVSTSTPAQQQQEIVTPDGSAIITYQLGDVLINEFVSDPSDGEEEWIELYNATGKEIDLSGWAIEEGSGAKTNLEGKLLASGSDKFKIISSIKGNLNNAGDIIYLRQPGGSIIDKVTYGNWNDGNLDDNAPAASDPGSVARKYDGYNTFNNAEDFSKTLTPTKGESNIITAEDEGADGSINNYEFSEDIIINELFPNPKGADLEKEFIEIFNKGNKDVNLLGWALENENGKKYLFSTSTIIKAKNYFIVYRKESKIVLNNSSDSVKLYEPLKEKYKEKIKYKSAKENFSFSLGNGGLWQWTEIITAGAENKIKAENNPPQVDYYLPEKLLVSMPFIFDASDAIDEDGDILKFKWDFGDGGKSDLEMPEHTYLRQGNFTVKLSVSDGQAEVKKEKIIKVVGFADEEVEVMPEDNANTIIINEILPSPVGADEEGEWIELYNLGDQEINLNNWQVENGTKSYVFQKNKYLKAGGYYVLKRPESGLALKNSGGYLALFDNTTNLLSELNYPSAKEGFSYARDRNGKWLWTNVLTAGKENIFTTSGSGGNAPLKSANQAVKGKKIKQLSSFSAPIKTTLEEVKDLAIGDIVNLKGTVAVIPGIFGVQYFYIVGSPALQIYNYKKDFPNLAVGDYVEVSGELSESSGELRVKTKEAGNIKLIEHKAIPQPEETTCEKIGEEAIWQLVKVAGEVTGKKGSEVYLDDGNSEAVLYLKRGTGLKASMFSEGDKIKVVGLAVNTKSGPRILPRSKDDITKDENTGEVLGEISNTNDWSLPARDKNKELLKYLLVIAGGIIIVLIGWVIKGRIKK